METNNENSHLQSFNQDNGVQQNGMQQTFTTIIHQPPPEIRKIKFEGARDINYDLKAIIDQVKQPTKPPTTEVIDFQDDLRKRNPKEVFEIPVKYLKFRKDNGRIISEVESYELEHNCILDESSEGTQEILRGFLHGNDREQNEKLKRLLAMTGQQQPAIATCDGFLINGNRRKMALEELYRDSKMDPAFRCMRVILLPEDVTEIEVQQVENRYQLQTEGKAEYKGVNRALIYRRNIQNGFSLKDQLKDDPNYHKLPEKKLAKEVEKYMSNFIQPLECIDRYLKSLGREGRYNSITEGNTDRQGRWQAFIDYSKLRNGPLANKEEMEALGIGRREKERLEMALFRVIRKRSLPAESHETQVGQLYRFIRDIPKYLRSPEATAEIMAIAKISNDLPEAEKRDANGVLLNDRDLDLKWGKKYGSEILERLQKARGYLNVLQAKDKPIPQLEDILRKFNYMSLDISGMSAEHCAKGLELVQQIRACAWKFSEMMETVINQQEHAGKKDDAAAPGTQDN